VYAKAWAERVVQRLVRISRVDAVLEQPRCQVFAGSAVPLKLKCRSFGSPHGFHARFFHGSIWCSSLARTAKAGRTSP